MLHIRRISLLLSLVAALAPLGALAAPPSIVLAHIAPLTGRAAEDAQGLNAGMLAYIAQANAKGGVAGRKLELLTLDDRYDGAEFAKQFAVAQARNPVALLSPLGVASMRALLEGGLLANSDLVVVNAVPGATPFRSPGHARLFHVRAGDRQQIEKMLLHAKILGLRRVTAWVQDLRVGSVDVKGAQAAQPDTLDIALRVLEMPATPDAMAKQAAEIAASDTQAVLVIGPPPDMAAGIAALRKAGMRKQMYALSYMPPPLLLKVAGGEAARGVAIVQTFPNPMGNNLPLQREFQAAMRAAAPKVVRYTSFHLEGYLTARVTVEGLRRIQGPISSAALGEALRRAGPTDMGGFLLDFGRNNAGGTYVDIGLIDARGRLIY